MFAFQYIAGHSKYLLTMRWSSKTPPSNVSFCKNLLHLTDLDNLLVKCEPKLETWDWCVETGQNKILVKLYQVWFWNVCTYRDDKLSRLKLELNL